jgi:hypothetical protein
MIIIKMDIVELIFQFIFCNKHIFINFNKYSPY